jgi:hypothetical protein
VKLPNRTDCPGGNDLDMRSERAWLEFLFGYRITEISLGFSVRQVKFRDGTLIRPRPFLSISFLVCVSLTVNDKSFSIAFTCTIKGRNVDNIARKY